MPPIVSQHEGSQGVTWEWRLAALVLGSWWLLAPTWTNRYTRLGKQVPPLRRKHLPCSWVKYLCFQSEIVSPDMSLTSWQVKSLTDF